MTEVEIRHFHLFCGLGGGAKGFNNGHAELGKLRAKFRCIGGVDVDAAAIRDFSKLAGVPGTVLDMFDREQFKSFHGREPGSDWREVTPDDICRAAGGERPHIVFLSAPCKGFSGLLSENRSKTEKYQALNRLTLRGVWLMLEAWGDDPPELILFENVPRIATRGRPLVDQISGLLRSYGYAVAETTHDCGELGGLSQSRKRFLLVARHVEKVPPFLYEPVKRNLGGVGQVLEKLPLPGVGLGGPMHRIPELQWKTWVRLAFVQAGSDWRSLNRLSVEEGFLKDYLLVPDMHRTVLGVKHWDDVGGTVTGNARASTGAFSVADPRYSGEAYGQYGVKRWGDTSSTVTSQRSPGQGSFSVADPRLDGVRHNNVFRVVRFDQPSPAVTGGKGPTAGGLAVADPRSGRDSYSAYGVCEWGFHSGVVTGESHPSNGRYAVADPRLRNWHPGASTSKMRVTPWDSPSRTVIGAGQVASGALAVADPRPKWGDSRPHYESGHYGVIPWESPAGAVSSSGKHDNGRFSVADPRSLPNPTDQLVARIISEDGTWHRPFTTLELAALQGLVDFDEDILLDGSSDSGWRERIGNAVPPPAAEAIAGEMGRTLLLTWSGETFALGSTPIWVRPIAVSISVAGAQ